ncbi:RNA-3'-phosphate cyclase [Methanococcus vannielii SB]|uniref:RNA 3'-terminal phosphate cyclase n=1 Tax=Methanococcus vannielii (strain ATCC 35089 / DSM 1224 / JCM 13029 / OCM 148 / SB) TaxID=406327 RepID=A6USG5_METVS|nr:RNA 3'-terminal phosphate cyclase [Methanococcus vannielii]ABR55437.1 RNA-3'-phosphate cyclase [Methanococcus vannielii SB]
MILIDGSYLEGGGQIVRTAISLSAVLNIPIKIINIRKNRKNPGLSNQHVSCVLAVSKLCNGKTEGLFKGSDTLLFYPGEILEEDFTIDIKSAGSISLVIQSLIPLSLLIKKTVEITIIGGTNVEFSPPIDYMEQITLKFLKNIGINFKIEKINRGFFPEGKGSVKLKLMPSKVKNLELIENTSKKINGIIFNQNIDESVSNRIKKSAFDELMKYGYDSRINIENTTGKSTGVGIFLWNNFLGSDFLGKKGISSEKVGKRAVDQLIREIDTKMAIDNHLTDQIIPFMPFSEIKIGVSGITNHTLTNIYVVERFFNVKFIIEDYLKNECNGYLIKTEKRC